MCKCRGGGGRDDLDMEDVLVGNNDNNNNNGYSLVLFLRRAHSPFVIKKNNNGVNIELGKTDRLKTLCMMQINI